MAIKISHNAKETAQKIFKYAEKYQDTIIDTGIEALKLAREQIINKYSAPDGARGNRYIRVKGATITRRRSDGSNYGEPIFHKSKVAVRTGDYIALFKDGSWQKSKAGALFIGHPDFISNVEVRGKQIIMTIGVKGNLETRAASFEKRGSRRRPINKGTKYAANRFNTLLVKNMDSIGTQYNA